MPPKFTLDSGYKLDTPGLRFDSEVPVQAPKSVWINPTNKPKPKTMNDYYLNRINMGRRVFACLDAPAHELLWKDQPPLRLTAAISEARVIFQDLETQAQKQSLATSGNAMDKLREEKELEDSAHELARLVVRCCRAAGDEATAAAYDLPISGWRRMRDETLLQTARTLEAKAAQIATTPAGTQYGITTARVAELKKEADDYAALIVAPDDAISARAVSQQKNRSHFARFSEALEEIDDLILPLRRTVAGAELVEKYQDARSINDRGRGPKEKKPDETAVPEPPTAPTT